MRGFKCKFDGVKWCGDHLFACNLITFPLFRVGENGAQWYNKIKIWIKEIGPDSGFLRGVRVVKNPLFLHRKKSFTRHDFVNIENALCDVIMYVCAQIQKAESKKKYLICLRSAPDPKWIEPPTFIFTFVDDNNKFYLTAFIACRSYLVNLLRLPFLSLYEKSGYFLAKKEELQPLLGK